MFGRYQGVVLDVVDQLSRAATVHLVKSNASRQLLPSEICQFIWAGGFLPTVFSEFHALFDDLRVIPRGNCVRVETDLLVHLVVLWCLFLGLLAFAKHTLPVHFVDFGLGNINLLGPVGDGDTSYRLLLRGWFSLLQAWKLFFCRLWWLICWLGWFRLYFLLDRWWNFTFRFRWGLDMKFFDQFSCLGFVHCHILFILLPELFKVIL